MDFLFFKADDTRLFTRNDAESGHWTVQEMNMTALFPYDSEKVIERGMRIGFDDPNGSGFQFFEIRKVRTYEPDHYQEITAEHIAISELTDCHTGMLEVTDVTAQAALSSILTGTGWSIGNVTDSSTSSADFAMGSVWQDIISIRDGWNVTITPRVTYSASAITGRYLDIAPNTPTWRGVRLSINKNADEMGITYDDTELYTAFYGYGANQEAGSTEDADPLTFANVVWTATADHPAKPSGQTYIEDPAATALYGRNGTPRFGFYQNTEITNANILLEKTWLSLKNQSEPTVTIDCMVRDLYRLGYADQPLRLNDTAIIDIEPIGATLQRTIIQMDVDFNDPTATRVTIGTYIPNIVYINHEIAVQSGVGGNGRSGRSKNSESKAEAQRHEFEADINANNYEISLRAYQNDLDTTNNQLRQAEVNITAQGVRITAAEGTISNHDTTLAEHQAEISVNANKIGLVVSTVSGTNVINAASIVAAVNDSGSSVVIDADHIDLTGYVTATELFSGNTYTGSLGVSGSVSASTVNATTVNAGGLNFVTDNSSTPVLMKAVTIAGQGVANLGLLGTGSTGTLAIPDAVNNITLTGPVNDVYTLTATTYGGQTINIGNFSRAASSGTTLTGAWSGRYYTVTASPQGVTKTGIVYDGLVGTGSVTKSGKYVSRDFIVYSDDGEGDADTIIMQKSVSINAETVYNDGWGDARTASSYPHTYSTGQMVSVSTPSTTVGTATTNTYTLMQSGSNVILNWNEGNNGEGITVAQIASGGGGTRTATSIANIELGASDTGTSTHNATVYYDNSSQHTDNVPVSIDATAVYNAGVTAGQGGVPINVVKGNWAFAFVSPTIYGYRCIFSPSAGTGTSANAIINGSPVINGLSTASSTAQFEITDSGNTIFSKYAYLKHENDYAYILSVNSTPSDSNVMARLYVGGGGTPGENRSVSTLGGITLGANDIGTTTQQTLVTYTDNSTDTKSIVINASAVYAAGQAAGAGLVIEQVKNYGTVTTNNTDYTIRPSSGYDAMKSATFRVAVPPVYRTAENLSQTIVLPASHTGTAVISNNYVEYDTGPDTGNFPVVIDASAVYQKGVTDGAGAQFTPVTLTLQGNGPYSMAAIDLNSANNFNYAMYGRLYYWDSVDNDYVPFFTTAKYWYYSNYQADGGVYYKSGQSVTYYTAGQTYYNTYYTRS